MESQVKIDELFIKMIDETVARHSKILETMKNTLSWAKKV
jgi:hypothetical protein